LTIFADAEPANARRRRPVQAAPARIAANDVLEVLIG
jgi:hypothetical protein